MNVARSTPMSSVIAVTCINLKGSFLFALPTSELNASEA